ncbi:MAG: amidohydrolase family protein [Armatimonadetes bacterium]|nr:amidohydrolase family protein [Armatimonadota bacterium]
MMKVFISHCHTGATHFGLSANPQDGTLPRLAEILQANEVDGAVVFAPFEHENLGWGGQAAQTFADPNDWLLAELQDYPHLRGFATINPAQRDAAQRLAQLIRAGLKGVKVHPPVHGIAVNDPSLDEFWAAAEELNVPLHIHTGTHGGLLNTYRPMLLDEVAQRHPCLKIIMDHLGGYALFDEALAVLHNNRNVYAGLTQCSGRANVYRITWQRIDVLLDTVGPDRIIYGLDYPWNPDNQAALAEDLAWIRSWGLSREDTAKILGGNILRLIGEPND